MREGIYTSRNTKQLQLKHRGAILARICASRTFRVIGICGITGVLVDIDRPITWVCRYLFGFNPATDKFLHQPLFVGSIVVICGVCAYLGGLYLKNVLKRRHRANLPAK